MRGHAHAGPHRTVSRRARLRSAALVPLFLISYAEWGDRGSFLFQMPLEMLQAGRGSGAWLHPLVIGPALSLAMLLAAPWWPRIPRLLLLLALLLPTVVVLLMLLGGISSACWLSLLSLLPYLSVLALLLRSLRRPAR